MIFFDLDDTLISFKDSQRLGALAFWDEFRESLPCDRNGFPEIWNQVMLKHWAAYMAGEITYLEHRRRRMRELFGVSMDALSDSDADGYFSVYVDHYESSWTLFDDVRESLNSLVGLKLGIITNGEGDQQRRKLARLEIGHYFSPVICAGELKLWKPNPELFHEACRQASIDPSDCVYIGDDFEADYLASKEAGLKAIWLNRDGADLPGECECMVGSLSELTCYL